MYIRAWFHTNIHVFLYDLPGYTLYRSDRETKAGGVCVYIKNGIKYPCKLKSEPKFEI